MLQQSSSSHQAKTERLELNQDTWLHPTTSRDLAKRVEEEQKPRDAEYLLKTLDAAGERKLCSKKSSPYCLWGSLRALKSGSSQGNHKTRFYVSAVPDNVQPVSTADISHNLFPSKDGGRGNNAKSRGSTEEMDCALP